MDNEEISQLWNQYLQKIKGVADCKIVPRDPDLESLKQSMNIPSSSDDLVVQITMQPIEKIQIDFTIRDDGSVTFEGV